MQALLSYPELNSVVSADADYIIYKVCKHTNVYNYIIAIMIQLAMYIGLRLLLYYSF